MLRDFPGVELIVCQSGKQAHQLGLEKLLAILFGDVRMPKMRGPDFLDRIALLHLKTVRFAWTGQSEAERWKRTSHIAHQVLSELTEASKMIKLKHASLAFQSQLSIGPIESFPLRILDGQRNFSAAREILSSIGRDDISSARVAEFIEQDVELKARLLVVANSAWISPVQSVTSVPAAVSLLGLRVVGIINFGQAIQRKLGGESCVRDEIRRSLDYGTMLAFRLNRAIRSVNLPQELRDSVYQAATYVSFGRILFSSFNGRAYSNLREDCGDEDDEPERRQEERFGVSQEIAGAYKLCLWGMDEDACLAIASLTELSPNSAKIRAAIDVARRALQAHAQALKPPSVCGTGGFFGPMLTGPYQPPPRLRCARTMRLLRITAKHQVINPNLPLETDRMSVLSPGWGLTTAASIPVLRRNGLTGSNRMSACLSAAVESPGRGQVMGLPWFPVGMGCPPCRGPEGSGFCGSGGSRQTSRPAFPNPVCQRNHSWSVQSIRYQQRP